MADLTFVCVNGPSQEDLDVISAGIRSWNHRVLGDYEEARFAVLARDGAGKIVGGVNASYKWGWMYVGALWVHPDHRGQGVGSRLMAIAEEVAFAAGITKCRLETYDFQALEFYLRNGYEVFAQLESNPVGHTHYYLKKEDLTASRGRVHGSDDEP